MPPEHYEVGTDKEPNFEPQEKLFRRVHPKELNEDGEVDPTSIPTVQFGKTEQAAPSVIRQLYATYEDAIHPDCAGNNSVEEYGVFYLSCADLPRGLESGDGRSFDFLPSHMPEPTCRAHSVIRSTLSSDPTKLYCPHLAR